MSEHHHTHEIRVPKGVLIGAATLLSLTIVAVAAFRIAGVEPVAQVPPADTVQRSLDLRFADGPNGTVNIYRVLENGPDQVLDVVEPGEGGFIRGVLRSLARARRASGISREEPFRLILQTDGVMLLEDPATAQRIYLPAFGPTNLETFRRIIVGDDSTQ
ncbi:MAG: photosynthetic complex assembly protein PuhC [Wenzhouxiangella sp.]|jgi:putative photosynthetic complex assembly protein|nr:photosynthetic complex assembly protein PuhC [Wenzhouxiangella sp.]